MDNVIHNICIKDSCLIVYIKTWDETMKQVRFLDYFAFKEKNSIHREIGDVMIQTNSALLEELKQDIINRDGTMKEIEDVKSILFYDSWNQTIILEVLSKNIEFD